MISKPKEFTDAEAEAFLRYLHQDIALETAKKKRRELVEAFLKTELGLNLWKQWLWQKRTRKGK